MPQNIRFFRNFTFTSLIFLGVLYLSLLIISTPKIFSGFIMQLVYLVQFCSLNPLNLFSLTNTFQFWVNIAGGLFLIYLYLNIFKAVILSLLSLHKTRNFLRSLPIISTNSQYSLFKSPFPQALTLGFFQPRIYLSTSLKKICTPPEIQTILIHEREHLSNHDPFKNFLINFLRSSLPIFPGKNFIFNHYFTLIEISCDHSVFCSLSNQLPLFTALQKIIKNQFQPTLINTLSFAGHASQRISILTGQKSLSFKKYFSLHLSALITFSFIALFVSRTDLLLDCPHLARCLRSLFQNSTSLHQITPEIRYIPNIIKTCH